MIFRIRQCCCDLPTLVRLVAIFFLVFHMLLVLSSALWYTLFNENEYDDNTNEEENSKQTAQSAGEVNDNVFDAFTASSSSQGGKRRNDSLDLLIVILLSVFAAIGILVNILVLVGIKLSQRSLFLPWLVFHLMAVVGCFAGGVYLALWFTVLQPELETQEKILSVFALFPIVGGIFLIFLWIFVDQLYIIMGVKKRPILPSSSAPGSSALQRKNSSSVMVIDHSSYSTSYATLPRPGKVLGVGDLERRQFATPNTPSRRPHNRRPGRPVMRTKSMSTSQHTLPRGRGGLNTKHLPMASEAFDVMQRHQRARSLEHILDQGSSIGPNYWVADGAKLISHKRGGGGASVSQAHTPSMTPRNNNTTRPLPQTAYLQQQQRASSVERMLDESSLDTNSTSVPSYCTVDRRIKPRPRRPPTSSDESSDIPPRPLRPRVYKVNSFQQRPGQQTVELYVDQKHHRGHTMASNSQNERNNGMIIQYDDVDGLGLGDDDVDQGVTRFDLSEDTATAAGDLNSLKSSLVDLDLNLLPLDAKTLPEEAIRTSHNVHRRHHRNNRYNTDTIRSTHSAKSVKIANKVTEFHYSEDDQPPGTIHSSTKADWVPEPVYPHLPPPPPPPPPHLETFSRHDPTPPPPSPPPNQQELMSPKSWLSRLSPLKSRKDFENEKNVVDLYYSVSDVRL